MEVDYYKIRKFVPKEIYKVNSFFDRIIDMEILGNLARQS